MRDFVYTEEQVTDALRLAQENREYDTVTATDMVNEVRYWLNVIREGDKENG